MLLETCNIDKSSFDDQIYDINYNKISVTGSYTCNSVCYV
jgi:hypothetical protein